jgi:hypothetical protein
MPVVSGACYAVEGGRVGEVEDAVLNLSIRPTPAEDILLGPKWQGFWPLLRQTPKKKQQLIRNNTLSYRPSSVPSIICSFLQIVNST